MQRLSTVCRCFGSVSGMMALAGCSLGGRAASRAARPPRRTWRSLFRPAPPPARSRRATARKRQRAARRGGRQLPADARGDRRSSTARPAPCCCWSRPSSATRRPARPATDTAVWGPHSEPLDKNAWRLTVTRVDRHVFSWKLDGKPKAADDSTFVTLLSGTHTRAVNGAATRWRTTAAARSSSTGTWRRRCPITTRRSASRRSRIRALAPGAGHDDRRRLQGHQGRTRPRPSSTTRSTATRRRRARAASCKYAAKRDYYPEPHPSGTAKENFTIHSRWQETARGAPTTSCRAATSRRRYRRRSTVSECWDIELPSQYLNVSYDPTPARLGRGNELRLSPSRPRS